MRWWTKKYRLPSNHSLYLDSVLEDLLVEFFEDYYIDNPLEVYRTEEGKIFFSNTGDDLIDKWEREIADGKEPDLTEAFNEQNIDKIKRWAVSRQRRREGRGTTFGDVARTINQRQEQLAQELEPGKPRINKQRSTFGDGT